MFDILKNYPKNLGASMTSSSLDRAGLETQV